MSYRPSSVGIKPSGTSIRASGASIRASIRARQLAAGYKASGLLGLLGLGTDIATSPAISAPMDAGPNAAGPGTLTITATVPTQAPDGSMSQLVPVATMSSAPKKWYSFLETTKPDGTVTGPLGFSWTIWLIGAGGAALYMANRSEGGGGGDTTPNVRRRRKARRNRRKR